LIAAKVNRYCWETFNGDGSPDLAVVVKPISERSLLKLNSEYANWIVEDPRRIELPDANRAVQRLPQPTPPPLIKPNDVLLLVLHGYGESGWHHPYARQTFLLCNAVGEHLQSLPLQEQLGNAREKYSISASRQCYHSETVGACRFSLLDQRQICLASVAFRGRRDLWVRRADIIWKGKIMICQRLV
jgi:hypothetical protein